MSHHHLAHFAFATLAFASPLAAQNARLVVDPIIYGDRPAADTRIRYRTYDPDHIITLVGHTGYQIMVEIEPDDRVETIAIGDASGWQITPNAASNLVFLKPIGLGRPTNLSIVTRQRRYNFELQARDGARARRSDILYTLRFTYPETAAGQPNTADAAPPVEVTGVVNRQYSFEGSDLNVPAELFDNGKSTYFRFVEGSPQPAIFAIVPGSGETVVNVAHRGSYIVVDQVASAFVLRQGDEVTKIYNDGLKPFTLDADAPKRRPKRKRGFLGL